jgi:hypothetical protein
MPDDTVIDGEVVALDADGKPSFNTLQNYGSSGAPVHFFIFDVPVLKGKPVMGDPGPWHGLAQPQPTVVSLNQARARSAGIRRTAAL